MKLAKDVLLEIVDIIRNGLVAGTDVSQALRNLDLSKNEDDTLSLSKEYKRVDWLMPIYTYECSKCKAVIELEQSIVSRVAPMCLNENCTLEMVSIIGKTSFILKGSSWARDGYK